MIESQIVLKSNRTFFLQQVTVQLKSSLKCVSNYIEDGPVLGSLYFMHNWLDFRLAAWP